MGNLSNIGRIFYGVAIAAMGYLTIYYHEFSYMMIPQQHAWVSGHTMIAYISGAFLFLAGGWIVFGRNIMSISLLLGLVLLLVFCFYFIPYEFIVSANYMHLGDWENAIKGIDAIQWRICDRRLLFQRQMRDSLIHFCESLYPLGLLSLP